MARSLNNGSIESTQTRTKQNEQTTIKIAMAFKQAQPAATEPQHISSSCGVPSTSRRMYTARDCQAESDFPTLTLYVDVDQAGDADLAALASPKTSSRNTDIFRGSNAAQDGNIWVQ